MPEDRDGPEDRDRPEEDGPLAGIEPTDALELPPSVATSEPVRPPPPPEEIPTFEDVEDITFEPRPPETDELLEPEEVKHFPAPQRPRGTGAPTTLQRRRFATLAAAADVLLPRGGPIEASAMDLGLAERLDRALALYDPAARRSLGRALRFLEWSTVFSRALRPFSRLPVPTRQAAFDRLRRSRSTLRRQAAETVASLAANQWAAHPDVEGALGFTYACVTDDPPRDAEPLEVLGFPRVDRDHLEECDVVVVGSGAGGAVVAKELAEVGHSVIVLEEGASLTRIDFTGPPLERMRRMYRANGLTASFGAPGMAMPLGMGVGGSTLVSAGTAMRAPGRVLGRWESDHGIEGIDDASMRPFYERVERIQRVTQVSDALLGQNARVIARGVEKLGHTAALVTRMIEGCRGCGVCSWGCPSDAKLSTHLTYLPRAQRAGASIYAGARAERILITDGRATGVEAVLVDAATRQPRARLTVRAKMVVLAAGAIHTPALLARNALGNLTGQLGRNLHVGPVAHVGAFFDQPATGWRGTLQPLVIDDWHESHGLLLHATASVPSVAAGMLPAVGSELKEMLGRLGHFASITVTAADSPSGRVFPRGAHEPLVRYRLGQTDAKRVVRGVIHAAEILLAAGARGVVTGLPGVDAVIGASALRDIDEDGIAPKGLRLVAQHPGGTARIGPDPASAVTDPWGEVHGVAGLFVADASLLPGSPAVPPQLTIMALATRTADHIARHASRWF